MRRFQYISFLFVLLVPFFLSCDPTDFDLPSYRANILLPILNVELSTEELILADTNEIIREDSAGLVFLAYQLSESRTLEEIVPLTDQKLDFTIPGFPSEIPDIIFDVPLTSEILGIVPAFYTVFPPRTFSTEVESNVDEFLGAEFESGTISLSVLNNFPFPMEAGFTIQLINKGDSVPIYEFSNDSEVLPGEEYIFEDADLADKFVSGNLVFKIINLGTPGGNNVEITAENALVFTTEYRNIKLRRATFKNPQFTSRPVDLEIPLIFPSGALIQRARLDSVNLSLEIPGISEEILVRLTLLSAATDGIPLVFELGNESINLELTDLEFDLTQSNPPYNIIRTQLELIFSENIEEIEVEFDKPLDGRIELTNIDYDFLVGYMGRYEELLEGNVDLDLFNRIQSGSIELEDPRITLTVSNGVGVTARAEDDGEGLYLKGANDRLFPEDTVTLSQALDGFIISPASFPGNPQVSVLEINKETEPDFGRFFSIFPTFIDLRLPIIGGTDFVNLGQFLDDDAEIGVDLGIELPLNVKADNLIILDTADFKVEFNPEKFEAKSASLTTRVENFFPFELNLQVYFLDSTQVLIDSLFNDIRIVEAAILDDDGKVSEPLITEVFIEILQGQLEGIRNTSYAVPVIRLRTQDEQFVKLFSSYRFNLKMTGEILTDVNLSP